MKKTNKKDTLNLIFSAFLIVGFIVCSYFFLTMASAKPDIAPYINTLVFTVFGLILFYATRVGEGVPVKRFSLFTLLILDLPALYAILAHFIEALPLHEQITALDNVVALPYSPLFIMACVALGYGIPYTFLSGYELKAEDEISQEANEVDARDYDSTEFQYVLASAEDENALLVVDDCDSAYNEDTDIRLSDVYPCEDEVKVGSYVVCREVEASEEYK